MNHFMNIIFEGFPYKFMGTKQKTERFSSAVTDWKLGVATTTS